MVSIRSPHKLPGENGMHARDGSLTKRKKEQWEREKVENEQTNGWFAKFGQKHTPGRRRAWATTAEEKTENEQRQQQNQSNERGGEERETKHQQFNEQQHNDTQPNGGIERLPPVGHPPSPFVHPPPSLPPAMLYGTPSAFPLQAPPAPLHFFTTPTHGAQPMHLFGEYQAQCQRQFISGAMPIFPHFAPTPQVIDTAAFILAAHQQQRFPLGMSQHPLMPTPPFSCPSSLEEAGGNNSPAVEHNQQQQQQHQLQNVCLSDFEQQNNGNNSADATMMLCQPAEMNIGNTSNSHKMGPSNANFVRSARRSLSMDASGTWEEELARQVAEKQMSAEREAQRALEEERVREKEERECRAREQAEREAEERRRMDRIEARDQTERATFASLQKAQRESELLRRAKLFRHILLDGDGQADIDTARQVLKSGPEEEAMLADVIKQLRDFDRQKRLANESCGSLSPSTGKVTPKTVAKMTVGKTTPTPSPTGFNRANSWNVKHSRTMPVDFSAPIIAQFPKMPSPAAVLAENHQQKNVEFTSKKTAKSTDKERQNGIMTNEALNSATSASSSQYYHDNIATVISPTFATAYGSSGSEKSTPDKKSFRQKVQNAVRNGAAAMLRRKESMGKTPTTTNGGGGGPKVLRTVGLFEQVTLRHRTASTSSNKQKQKTDQKQLNKANNNNNSDCPHSPAASAHQSFETETVPLSLPSPTSPPTTPLTDTDAKIDSSTAPIPPQHHRHPTARTEASSFYSVQTVEFLLPPPPPVATDRRRQRPQRQQIEPPKMTNKTKAMAREKGEERQGEEQQKAMIKQKQEMMEEMGGFEGEEENFNEYSGENGHDDDEGGTETAKCQQNGRRQNGTGKAMQQISPPGSSSATSSSSASLLRFRAALDSPFGSREDISNSLTTINVNNGHNVFPSTPSKFVGGPLRHANGGSSVAVAHHSHHAHHPHQQHLTHLAPPSPFRRPTCAGDSSEPLLRRSLRSPTMRRLQESLQSLAEDVPISPAVGGARGDASRAETPKPFHCRTSQYRSLNLKRDTERQKQILEHLAQVRAQLKNSQVQIERSINGKQ